MARRLVRALAFAAALFCGAPLAGLCQHGALEILADENFYDAIEVNLVNVEVFVADRQGRRVTGLGRDDFEIREDGAPVAVTHFHAAGAGGPAAPGAQSGEQGLHLAVFIDNQSLSPAARDRLIPALRQFVTTRMRPRELLLLASYDGPGSLKLRQAPTDQPAAMAAALDEIAALSPGALAKHLESRALLYQMRAFSRGRMGTCRAGGDVSALLANIDSHAERVYEDLRETYSALDRFVQALSALPGRKAVLFIGGEATLEPARALYGIWDKRFDCGDGEAGAESKLRDIGREADELLSRVEARAGANRVSLYSLSAPSLARTGTETGLFDLSNIDQEVVSSADLERSLFRMSAGTSGLAEGEATDPGALLARLRDDFDTYYSLGYHPAHRRTGRDHRIEVRVKRRGLKVRHRETYRDRGSPEILRDLTLAALLFGPRQNPLKVELEFDHETAPDEGGQREVTVAVKLPISNLVLVPRGEFHEGRVTIQLVTHDEQGRSSGVQEFDVPVRVPNRQFLTALGWVAGYRAKLVLPPRSHVVAVGVRDELGNAVSTVTGAYPPERWAAETAAARPTAATMAAGPPQEASEGKP